MRDPTLDHRKPEILLYEPQADGSLRLVGIEYFVLGHRAEERAAHSRALVPRVR
jgi:hypothetical protein